MDSCLSWAGRGAALNLRGSVVIKPIVHTCRRSTTQIRCKAHRLDCDHLNRREWVVGVLPSACVTSLYLPPQSLALPLAPLGDVKRVGGEKLKNASIAVIRDTIERDLKVGQYLATGRLTPEIFADDCRFIDPTNDVVGLSKYIAALGILFDPAYSKLELLSPVKVTSDNTIEADYRLGGYFQSKYFPWQPRVKPYEGHITYTLNKEGLIQVQSQTWSISALEALRETFTPTFGPKQKIHSNWFPQ